MRGLLYDAPQVVDVSSLCPMFVPLVDMLCLPLLVLRAELLTDGLGATLRLAPFLIPAHAREVDGLPDADVVRRDKKMEKESMCDHPGDAAAVDGDEVETLACLDAEALVATHRAIGRSTRWVGVGGPPWRVVRSN